jgi:hypothetical protein
MAKLYESAKKRNLLAGIIISDVIAFICFAIVQYGIFNPGDFQMVIGCVIGTRFALKYQKDKHHIILLSIVIALSGTFLSAISFGILDSMIILLHGLGGVSLLFVIFIRYFLMATIIGVLLGILLGIYYFIKSEKPIKEPLIDEEFYESLK